MTDNTISERENQSLPSHSSLSPSLATLTNKRGTLKGKVTRLRNYIASIDENNLNQNTLFELTTRLENLHLVYNDFDTVQTEIESLNPSLDHDTYREIFENLYFSLTGEIKALISNFNEGVKNRCRSEVNSLPNNATVNKSRLLLPPIKLPTFDGQYSNWLEFKDSFTALVHNDDTISDIEKFYHLRSSLQKDAAQIIKSVDVSAANYKNAWQLLVDRYENKSLIIHNHIKAIFEHPTINKESHIDLRNLLDNVIKNLRSLKSLGEDTDSWDRLIIYIVSSKFDCVTRRDWESYSFDGELPTMSDLNKFLKSKCEILEKLHITKQEKIKSSPIIHNHVTSKRFTSSNSLTATCENKQQCYYCSKDHNIYNCENFLALCVEDRLAAAKKIKVCLNCLRYNNHPSWKCKAQKCRKCNKRHNTLLHLEGHNKGSTSSVPEIKNTIAESPETKNVYNKDTNADANFTNNNDNLSIPLTQNFSLNNHSYECSFSNLTSYSQVLLSTVMVKIKLNEGYITCRALLDSGSQSNFITESLCRKLNIQSTKINHTVKGVGQALSSINKQVNVTIMSLYNDFRKEINCLVLSKITDRLPMVSFNKKLLNIPENLELADPSFNIIGDIDILLGSSVFWSVICHDQRQLGENLPTLQNTRFGWIIGGNLFSNSMCNLSISCLNVNNRNNCLEEKIAKFWTLEEVENKVSTVLSESERFCEQHFVKTTKRNSDGRFIINIPFKESLTELGNSRNTAIKRFLMLERKLMKNPELRTDYAKFMLEYENLSHMTEINNTEGDIDGYFLPHHAVIKISSVTTKCRVVFDASAKTDSNLSLNDVQFKGPTLQQDIFSILIRFRKYKFVMTADISKMYRQILVDDTQRKYQKIFWRDHPDRELKCYQLNTVTYGTTSAPYLSTRCLVQLGMENKEKFPVASKVILDDFYVDDLLTGADTVEEALKLQHNVSKILSSVGFELRKWMSNSKEIVRKLYVNSNLEIGVLQIGENESNKTLGVLWDCNNDTIKFSLSDLTSTKMTKRSILSVICQIFDPLGLLAPLIIVAKITMQELWQLKIGWDEQVPDNLRIRWSNFLNELQIINEYSIDRQVLVSDYVRIEIHGFCDASIRAYGACVYIRCTTSEGHFSKLICAKSRVAPLKTVSLPRLELCGAVLLANLMKRTIESLEISFHANYFWTDSEITLAWIKGSPNKWKTFVANRVSEIQNLSEINEWHHVKSKENPADLISRGTTPILLKESRLWWCGPEWFSLNNNDWDMSMSSTDFEIPEQRSYTNLVVAHSDMVADLINRYSSIGKIQRVLAFVLRFINNVKDSKNYRESGPLTPYELDVALIQLIKNIQIKCFQEDYCCLLKGKQINSKSPILSLNPFMHDELIRVGGRIKNSKHPYDKRHPILLPKNNRLTELILRNEHERLLHCGAQNLLCSIRERYWPISGRNVCKRIVKSCIKCLKAKPVYSSCLMGDLPDVRVNDYSPFLNVGVDYGGPVLLKDRKTRNPKIIKSYICLFVCMSTKAVHLELVSDLTTDAFIAALKRFSGRRGKPSNIYSDNSQTFVGANKELVQLHEFLRNNSDIIANHLACDQTKWHFIPPYSPNFGGIWEAGIKSTKYHLKRVLGTSILTFEEFSTLLVQIESILNSRPLCPLSHDPEDLAPLTPAHFLIGKSLTALPEAHLLDVPENRLSRFQRLQSMCQHFWSRWSKEYLAELQTRIKWKHSSMQYLKPGALVLVKSDNSPPLYWKLGRITAVFLGNDGISRVADIKTQGGLIRRSVRHLCVLPSDECSHNPDIVR